MDLAVFRHALLHSLRPNKFLMSVMVPQALQTSWTDAQRARFHPIVKNLVYGYQCDTSALPGRTLATNEISRMSLMPRQKLAHASSFTDLAVTYYLSGHKESHARDLVELFTSWHNFIHQTQDSGGFEPTDYSAYTLEYFDNYATTAQVSLLAAEANAPSSTILTYYLNGLYPVSVGDVALSWHEDSTVLKLSVTYTYRSWTTYVPVGTPPPPPSQTSSQTPPKYNGAMLNIT